VGTHLLVIPPSLESALVFWVWELSDKLQVDSISKSIELIGEMEELDGDLQGYKTRLILEEVDNALLAQ